MAIKCHEFFACKREVECPFYTDETGRNCWEVEVALTPFVGAGEEDFREEDKIVHCKNCLYYQHVHKIKD